MHAASILVARISGSRGQGYLDSGLTVVMKVCVVIILTTAVRNWTGGGQVSGVT